MDKRFLESSEFYNRRYDNFSTIIILPIVVVLICVVIFSLSAKREITVEGHGTIDTEKSVPVIQGTANSMIQNNYLKEGGFVKKGQKLLVYKNNNNKNQLELLHSQKDNLDEQISALETLKSGLEKNQNTFEQGDKFGYKDLLIGYLNQREIYVIENKKLTEKSNEDTTKQQETDKLLNDALNRNQNNLLAYQTIRDVINSNESYPKNSKYYYIYQGYLAKKNELSEQGEKDNLKSDVLTSLQERIDSLQNLVDETKSQKVALQDFNDLDANINTNGEKLSSLKEQQMQSANQQLTKCKQELIEIQIKMKQLWSDNREYIIRAPKSGVVHLNDAFKGVSYTGTGSTLAQIYPNLTNQESIEIRAYVSSQDIASVNKKERLRLQIIRNVPKPLILEGRINNISVSPVPMDKGSYYVVTAKAMLNAKTKTLLHYGMTGKTSIITGSSSFYNYYKNKLLGD